MKMRTSAIAVSLMLSWSTAVTAQLADTPWPKFQHDLRNSGCSEYVGPAQPVVVGWSSFAGQTLGSQIVLGKDGDAYVFWGFTDVENRREDARPEYFGWGDDDYPSFSRLERFRADGSRVWGRRITPWGTSTPCLNREGRVFAASDDSIYYGGRLCAFSAQGLPLWRSDYLDIVQYTHLTIGPNGVVYHPTDAGLFAFASDGTLLWRYGSYFEFQCPSVGLDGTVYLAQFGVVAINPDGSRRWYAELGYDGGGTALAEDGTIYTLRWPGHSRMDLIALNPDGTLRWQHALEWLATAQPAVGPDGTVYVVSTQESPDEQGLLWAINPDGTRKWTAEFQTGTDAPVVVDAAGNTYVVYYRSYEPWKTTLVSFNADGEERWRFDLGFALASTGPVINSKGQLLIYAQKEGDPEPAMRILTIGDGSDPTPQAIDRP